MDQDWLEFAQRLAEGARAKVAEDRKRLEEIKQQSAAREEKAAVAASR